MNFNIETVNDIVKLLLSGFTEWNQLGHVNVTTYDNLTLFNYSSAAGKVDDWNQFEILSRGLLIDNQTGEVVIRGFDKYFNWQERGRVATGHIVTVTEKVDGSCGMLYYDKNQQSYRIATRGSLVSEQAQWATRFLHEMYPDINNLWDTNWKDYTLIFEIIYPDNRIVCNYGNREDLVLLAVRNRHTGVYLPFFPALYEFAQEWQFSTPKIYSFNDVTQLIEATGKPEYQSNNEGWVVEFSDGSRFKFKTDEYLYLHKLITGINFKRVLGAVRNNTLNNYIEVIPEEFLGDVYKYRDYIYQYKQRIEDEISDWWSTLPKFVDGSVSLSRKEFAQKVYADVPHLSSYCFAILDEKDYHDLIYRTIEEGNADV